MYNKYRSCSSSPKRRRPTVVYKLVVSALLFLLAVASSSVYQDVRLSVSPFVTFGKMLVCQFFSNSVSQLCSCALLRRCAALRWRENGARSAAQSHLNGISAAISQDPNILELIPQFTRTSLLKFLLPIRVQETELKDLGGNLIAQDY